MSTEFDSEYKSILSNTQGALKDIFPIKGKSHTIVLKKSWTDEGHDTSFEAEKKTKLRNGTYGKNVYGEIHLIDNKTKKVIDVQKKVRLMSIPLKTHRDSYIVKGNEYQVKNQLRRMPSVYTFPMETGGDYKTQFNLAKGRNFDMFFDPAKKKFTVKVGGTQRPLYSLLHQLGVSDKDMEKSWGRDLMATNKAASKLEQDTRNLSKAFGVNQTPEDIKKYFDNTKINPSVTEITLGKKSDKVTPEVLLAAARKLKNVYRGEEDADDVESLTYKELHSTEDFLKEKLMKNARGIQGGIRKKLNRSNKLKDILKLNTLNENIEKFFTQDERSNVSEQYNPAHFMGSASRATLMGPGGITDTQLLKPSMRDTHPSHVGFMDPIQTPESEKVGTTLNLPLAVRKRKNEMITPVINVKSRKVEYKSPQELYEKKVAFPDQAQIDSGSILKRWLFPKIKVKYRNQLLEVPRSDVDYILPSTKNLFSVSSNLIPFIKNNQANRASFAAKQIEQAVPLKFREAPLVQPLHSKTGKSFAEILGSKYSSKAPDDGVVKKVTEDEVFIKSGRKTHRVPLYNNFPLNQTNFMHSTARVKAGDTVKKGQLLADSNFTKDGTLALGANLKTAYMVWPGSTFEDGVAISETGAKKLTSEHLYRYEQVRDGLRKFNKSAFMAHFPQKISSDNKEKLNKNGVIQKGSRVSPGDILIAALKQRPLTPEESVLFRRNRKMGKPMSDDSVTYENDVEGVVTDVVKTNKGYKVLIKTEEPAKVGDKISGLHGNKGIISEVIPDNMAPRTKDNRPIDLILNPHGVISRINVGQIYESAAGKLAKAKGSPYKFENFDHTDHRSFLDTSLKRFGLRDKETVTDASGNKLGDVHVGYPQILKLFKTGQSSLSARGVGPQGYGYDSSNFQPTRGGKKGAKKIDLMGAYSLLSHDARNILQEMSTRKSEYNPKFWEAIRTGKTPPPAKDTFAYKKFLNLLQGAGIDIKKDGTKVTLLPQTDKQVDFMSTGAIKKPEFINAKDLSARKGGYFDERITGGKQGSSFNHIELTEPMPNPMFEMPIKKLLGLNARQYGGLLGGTHSVENNKVVAGSKGVTGGEAFKKLLGGLNVDTEIEKYEDIIKNGSGAKQRQAYKNLRYLKTLKDNDLTPQEAYIKKKVAVLPAMFRPISAMSDGQDIQVAPINTLYQRVHLISDGLNKPAVSMLPEEDKGFIRADLYKAKTELMGATGEPFKRGGKTPVPGILQEISGMDSPKGGFFQRRLLAKNQEPTARGTIIPDKSLGVDEVGIPEKAAWPLFEPFVMRKLVGSGLSPSEAKKHIKNNTRLAKQTLENVMKDRPILYNRAPSLHKFSIMGAKPKLVQGNAIHIPHMVVKGFGADFDGDQMNVHVPVMPEAVREARDMFPSRHLFKPGTGALMMLPAQEGALGLYMASQTPGGRGLINKLLPRGIKVSKPMTKAESNLILRKLADKHPSEYSLVVDKLKNFGENVTYRSGFTLGLEDLKIDTSKRDLLVNRSINKARSLLSGKKNFYEQNQNAYNKVYKQSQKDIQTEMMKSLPDSNPLKMMIQSGARGNQNQLQQMLMTPLILKDSKDRPQSHLPVRKSYVEGLDVSDYFSSTYGARKGMIDRALETSLPGALSKNLMANTIDNVIAKIDCGTRDGLKRSPRDTDVVGRYSAGTQPGLRHNTLITSDVQKRMERAGVKTIKVRSPLRCRLGKGTCAKCFGQDEFGNLPNIGRNIGALAGQSITEPLQQMQMQSIHTGGMAGASMEAAGFERVKQIFDLTKFTGEVPVAESSGIVSDIRRSPAGGYDLTVDGKSYHVRSGNPLLVKKGQRVTKGQALAKGVVRPEAVMRTKGIGEAQNYVVDQLQDAYKNQGIDMNRKMFETVVRSTTNTTKIKLAPSDSGFHAGDVAPLTLVKMYNAKHKKKKIIHEPTMMGLINLPGARKNWMAQLGYRYGRKALREGAAEGWQTDTSDYHPIPAFAKGTTFGKGKDGRY